MLDPAARLGLLDVRGGTQLDDTAGAAGARVPGVLSLIATATCVVEDSWGAGAAPQVDDLRRTMADTDPARLGVPSWALADVRRALPERRLEGLVAPGTYDVRPGSDAAEALTSVVGTSTARLESGGLVTKAAANDVSPYQALVVGSIAESEGIESDFRRIARVVYNRLPVPMRLQMDSTINYPLDRQTLLTTPFDRAAPGPYNTYLNFGLPPTPIGAVSAPALQAALDPEAGGLGLLRQVRERRGLVLRRRRPRSTTPTGVSPRRAGCTDGEPRRARGVLGSPVAHSLSPVLHGAAYAALGLRGWTYERVECTAEDLPGLVAGLDETWVGLSVTMPGKRAALAVAAEATDAGAPARARRTRSSASADGWSADCTDVEGVAGALRAAGIREPAPLAAGLHDVVVLGAGATASAAVGAMAELGNEDVPARGARPRPGRRRRAPSSTPTGCAGSCAPSTRSTRSTRRGRRR